MKLAIFGAGGHGRVVADTAEASNIWTDISFFDSNWPKTQKNLDWSVIGNADDLLNTIDSFAGVIVAIGNNGARLAMQRRLEMAGAKIVTIVHPAAVISRRATIGTGSVVIAGAVINVGSRIGDACIINTGATVGHDCELGDAVHIAPGSSLAGATVVGARSWIGLGSKTRQLVQIGSDVMVGVGSVVVKDVPDNVVVAGNPARLLHS